MSRSLNRAELIGNITKDAEIRFTPSGASVCDFSVATNRSWKTEAGEKKEETEFHRIITWDKLADIIGKFGQKGKRVYIEGRIAHRKWIDKDGIDRDTSEIVANDVIFLDKLMTNELKGGEA